MEENKKLIMEKRLNLELYSEIGKLKGVILHRPGPEVENMTPENAERALYSDILNLSVANEEYDQFDGVLNKVSTVYYVKDMLADLLADDDKKLDLVDQVCMMEGIPQIRKELMTKDPVELAHILIEGHPLPMNCLTNFLSDERYSLQPLHNFFFMRDASLGLWNHAVISKMATRVRQRETTIMNAIFSHAFTNRVINPAKKIAAGKNVSYEGGDIQVISEKVILCGIGKRTTPEGVDFIINQLADEHEGEFTVIVQELPDSPESFIHLDMAFTMLSQEYCMVYAPLILERNKYPTIAIKVADGKVQNIHNEENVLTALKTCGIDLKPIYCGGKADRWIQEREQWHSGTNFFTLEPGKIIGYARNNHTIDELSKNGFEVIKANDFIHSELTLADFKQCVIAIEGSELARGGGGARCMSMPFLRDRV